EGRGLRCRLRGDELAGRRRDDRCRRRRRLRSARNRVQPARALRRRPVVVCARIVMTTVAADAQRSRGLGPVTTPTLVESVAEAIRESILSGRFAPGDRLVEAELARELHVSRGPIREALGLLGKDGIVVHEPRRGKFVQGLTPRLIDEVYSLRLLL